LIRTKQITDPPPASQAWFRRYAAASWEAEQRPHVEALQSRKLANGACVGVTVRYTPYRAEAISAQLLFGTRLNP
jgi:hypothetical protein